HTQSIGVPHLAARVFLFGHEFNRYFSGQVTYLRPVAWVRYENVNSDGGSHSVWMDVAGVTMRSRIPLGQKVSLYGEGGLGLVTRKGFDVNGVAAVKDAEYAAPLLGAGITYHLNSNWSVNTGLTFSPEHRSDLQPATSFLSMGFQYTMRPLPPEQVDKNV